MTLARIKTEHDLASREFYIEIDETDDLHWEVVLAGPEVPKIYDLLQQLYLRKLRTVFMNVASLSSTYAFAQTIQ